MPAVNEKMLIDTVDMGDRPTGVIRRSEVFRQHSGFRVVHILIFNDRREVLTQQLAMSRSRHPGYWGSSVAGYLFAGESYEDGAERRVAEEVGVAGMSLDYVGKTSMLDDGAHKFIGVFTATSNGPFHFDLNLINALEFLSQSSIDEMRFAGSRSFTPTFLHVLAFLKSRM